ncbi:hypothetical protein AABD46_25095 (plasmid) [Vibrio parahaemolyticus]|uniref:Uncharacterized protein n=1 Tax=Vibrio parahaemolyticus TaxID=670 RepID=A0AA47JNH1_VIBPH|nr:MULTISPECIES: hypothetical protein [Vibrio]MBE3780022.1 hypothetical protein [Vibrio parahaemolyticus]MCZ6249608.1 hypothetical protein [Vibrio parahaemolyticus]MCZ6279351.1 hypothetical protein [Vibrio parahaemolyticus]MDE0552117.1 hypothetical protein [Vibrio sp. VP6]MDF5495444.1 hypothetical protein [Vibrio parahaemolyticus]
MTSRGIKKPRTMEAIYCAKILVAHQQTFLAEQEAKAQVNFKLNTLIKSGKKARR